MDDLRESALDLVQCEQEPIHIPGAIQASSVLLLFDMQSGKLAAASDNLEDLFGASVHDLIGAEMERFFCERDAVALRTGPERPDAWTSRYLELRDGIEKWVTLFETDGLLGAEINTYESSDHDCVDFGLDVGKALGEIHRYTDRLGHATEENIREIAEIVTSRFRELSGYDRTMMYRFDTDWNGEVIGESFGERLDHSFLGLTFPSSDIPRQARHLFQRNRVRPVIDVEGEAVSLVPALNPRTGHKIDLSDCTVRGVSPVHIEYLRNMGVRATLTIALIVRDELWGLLTCHHYDGPYRLTPGRASACRLFCEAISAALSRIVERCESETVERVRNHLRQFRNDVLHAPSRSDFAHFLQDQAQTLLNLMNCDGMIFHLNGADNVFGAVPKPSVLSCIRDRLPKQMRLVQRDIFSTHFTAGLWPDLAEDVKAEAAGLLLFQPPEGNFSLLLFRRARQVEMTWAGDPYKRVSPEKEGERLHPRGSFDLWKETAQDRAAPWEREAAVAARELAMGLNEIDWLFEWQRSEAELAAARAETEYNALHDTLTDLPNRRFLQQRLEEADGGPFSTEPPAALIHIDLDGFKEINDTLGHSAGDELLVEVASRLKHLIRRDDFPARIGGDEFVVLVARGTGQDELHAIGQRIVDFMARPFESESGECRFGASVGVALYDPHIAIDELFHRADLALYESKHTGRGRVTFFSDELEQRQRELQLLGGEIRDGIDSGQFQVWYQPQVDAATYQLTGLEALLRWHHPTRGVLSPAHFLQHSEDMGMLAALDRIGMETALADLAWLHARGHDIPKISLNVSARRLQDPDLIETIREMGPERNALSFELLESIYLDEVDPVMEANLQGLRDLGIPIEVDDFGTGRTSIVSLVSLRPDRLKIDRQLVEPVVRSDAARRLIASIVEIGQSLDIGITAEGVETEDHARIMHDLGCTVLQGFHFARPMPKSELATFLDGRENNVA
ncbi:diguanylate cyclase/phosphodiesterase (GGDEF & EAL domains) with PAS/PAC sensor(s) [Rhodovulum sp. P5]|uniref:bifunctional diguanylate cyclase/phosphodiesterase n=1 Tax=Rhodovulum sp. P5 TaxID=1564506 RepID=UPI0009C209DC|nr:EAL domain-containing protein [Rhodovulum sp. P5]ARE39246.1 diguanylate cyclase/phosphodiesterase (GGDEF & EAL domains) with PAS/PAC sensor(s) [Rhodovulum sp. P5]